MRDDRMRWALVIPVPHVAAQQSAHPQDSFCVVISINGDLDHFSKEIKNEDRCDDLDPIDRLYVASVRSASM